MLELKEFKCIECGHTVVVNPKLPADYMPTVCMQCWNDIVGPRHKAAEVAIMLKARELLLQCGCEDPAPPELRALLNPVNMAQ